MTTGQATAAGGGMLAGWPAYLITLLVFAAAVFSFSHRPIPEFPATVVRPDKLLVNGLAQSGSRIVAAGELGHILIADSPDGPWREARIEPNRGSTFTRAAFVDERTAIAVGHDGWIVRSEDGGETWKEVAFDEQRPDPLLGLAGPFEGRLYAFGAFGLFTTSTDAGRSWQAAPLVIEGEEQAAAEPDPNEDPFANFGRADSVADRHFNALVQLTDGTLLLAGERGALLQSRDQGASWRALDSIYAGTFFGALALADNRVLVFGMRGNVFLGADGGKTWTRSETPVTVSLFSGAQLPGGEIVLVGDNNSVLVSKDGGAVFTVASQAEHRGLAAGLAEVLPLPDGGLLAAGDAGIIRVGAAAGDRP